MAAKTVNVEAEIEFLLSDKARKDSKSNTAKALSEEAFLKCWEALGTNNDADRIKVMLNALQQWRQGIPGRSRAPMKRLQEWWQLLLRCWHEETDCDRAITDSLKYLNEV